MAPNRNAPCPCGSGIKQKKCKCRDGTSRREAPSEHLIQATDTDSTAQVIISAEQVIEDFLPHPNLKQTSDPAAQDYIYAHEIWGIALRMLRSGEMAQAKILFVSAWLRDERVARE